MAKKLEEQKLIVIESSGSITELGGISGPVINPCLVPISTILSMLNHHRRVYEVNPKNHNEKVRLTLKNLRTQNFKVEEVAPVIKAEPPKAPVAHKAPVVDSKKPEELKNDTTMVTPKVEAPKAETGDFVKK